MIVLYWIVLPKEKLYKCQIWVIWVSQGRLTDFGPKSSCGLVLVMTMMTSRLRHMTTRYSLSVSWLMFGQITLWVHGFCLPHVQSVNIKCVCRINGIMWPVWRVIMTSLEINTHFTVSVGNRWTFVHEHNHQVSTHTLIWDTHTQILFVNRRYVSVKVSWTHSPWLVGAAYEQPVIGQFRSCWVFTF